MTEVSMELAEFIEKGAQEDIVRELLGHVAQRLMDFEIEQRTGAVYGEDIQDRSNSRNGYPAKVLDCTAEFVVLMQLANAQVAKSQRCNEASDRRPIPMASS